MDKEDYIAWGMSMAIGTPIILVLCWLGMLWNALAWNAPIPDSLSPERSAASRLVVRMHLQAPDSLAPEAHPGCPS